MSILVLGGTLDARQITETLIKKGKTCIYSVKGLVRIPNLPCQVIEGGFEVRGGLEHYSRIAAVTCIVDATHPFATKMSQKALKVANIIGIPYIRFNRDAWDAEAADQWTHFSNINALLSALTSFKRVFLSLGQPDANVKAYVERHLEQRFLLRTAVKPDWQWPDNVTWIKAIGPFHLEDEVHLLQQNRIDLMVSKNSGGNATYAKLVAARSMQIKVFMLDRPTEDKRLYHFNTQSACVEACLSLLPSSDTN